MARKRFITSDMSIDERIAEIAAQNPVAALMWPWFITGFDDWGRMEAAPIKIKLSIFPAFPYTAKDIEEAINLYAKHGLVHKYEVDGKQYLAINPKKFYKYQTYIRSDKRETDGSSCPPPPNPPWDSEDNLQTADNSANGQTEDTLRTDARNCAQDSTDERNCIPSPSPSPSPSLSPSPTGDGNIDSRPNPSGSDAPQESQEIFNNSKNEPKYTEDSSPYKAALYLRNRILSNNPRARVPRDDPEDPLMQKWAQEMDRLHRIGPPGGNKGYSWEEIRQLIDFSQDDDFWQANILSAGKLREKCIQLENQMRRDTQRARGHPVMSKNVANALRLVEKYSQEEGEYR